MKRILFLLSALLTSSMVFAQAPDAFKYQAVVRDNSGNLITEQAVGIQIEILKGAADGTSVYNETHSVTTNAYGLVNLEIGSGTSTEDLATVNWGDDDYFIQVSLDATGGTSYELMGTSQLLSVPYALHADAADTVYNESQELVISGNTLSISQGNSVELPHGGGSNGNEMFVLSGNITDAEAAQKIADEVGENTKYIHISYTSQLTTVSFEGVSELIEVIVQGNHALTTIDFNDLTSVREVYINMNPTLTTLILDSLKFGGKIAIHQTNTETISFPLLQSISWGLNITDNPLLTSIDANSLISSAACLITNNLLLSSLSFPSLQSTSNMNCENNPVLSSVSFGILSTIGNWFTFASCALSSETINAFLAQIVSITPSVTGAYIMLNGQTPPAPPTGQGITDKATLIANGNTVETD